MKNTLKTNVSSDIREAYSKEGITGDGKLIVLFLFNSKEEMGLVRMHPEMMQVDTPHGANNEKKEVFTMMSTDGNNKAFNACRGYLPKGLSKLKINHTCTKSYP